VIECVASNALHVGKDRRGAPIVLRRRHHYPRVFRTAQQRFRHRYIPAGHELDVQRFRSADLLAYSQRRRRN